MSAGAFGKPKCPECEREVDLTEYIQVTVERVYNEQPTVLGIEMYHEDCWYGLQEEADGQAKKDRA